MHIKGAYLVQEGSWKINICNLPLCMSDAYIFWCSQGQGAETRYHSEKNSMMSKNPVPCHLNKLLSKVLLLVHLSIQGFSWPNTSC